MLFSSLDGSAQDSDGLANGVFTVNGDLVIDGTINCNDDVPLPSSAGACPIRISTTGDLTVEAGGGIFAENRRGGGNGGDIRLDVGGSLTLHGPDVSLPGAVVSTSRNNGTVGTAGSLTAVVAGSVDLEAGSALAASSIGGNGGPISVTGETVTVAGLVASGPSRTVLASPLTGKVLDDGNSGQTGGTVYLRALGSTEPGLRIEPMGIVVSQGEGGGSRLVLLEACGIEVNGLVASVSKNNGPSQVALRSGKGILIDGRDLGNAAPADGRFGRVRADSTQQGAAGYLVDLFAQSDIQVLGPDPSATALFAVSSTPGDQPLRFAGGTITAISLAGALDATGNAFETGNTVNGDKGGDVDLQAQDDVTLDGATLRAVGDYTSTSNARAGGHIAVRSYQGAVSWTFGIGDVRPTGTGIPAARRGAIEITACSTVDTTGSQFPVNGSVVAPFPVENEGVCSPTSPSLPSGEPPLPVCAPPNSPPAPSGGPFSVAENSANGTSVGTVAANDPDAGQTHTFSILPAGNTDGAFAINSTTGEITVANSAALDFETNPTFNLTVQATDNGTPPLSGTGTVVVNLTNENEQPTNINLSNASVSENQPSGTLVGVFSTVDPDTTDSFTYTLAAGTGDTDNLSFQIAGDQLKTNASFNYEVKSSYSIRVRSTDSGGLFTEKVFTITVLDAPEAPLAVDDAYDTIGNTRLEVRNVPSAGGPKVVVTGDVMDNDSDPDTGTTLAVIAASGTTTKGGSFSILADGTFTYEPEAGDIHGTGTEDTFTYTLTDGTLEATGTVRIKTVARVWYVKNDAPASGTGRSHEPFDTLAAAQSASGAGDYIFVYLGDGASTGQDVGITLQSGQHLLGEHAGLTIPITLGTFNGTPAPTNVDLVTAVPGNRPLIDNAGGNAVSATDAIPVEIVGLSLSGSLNAVDWTTTGTFSNSGTLDIKNNVIRSAGAEGIDVNAGGTGTLTLNLTGNEFTGAAANNGIDLRNTAGALHADLSNNTNVLSNTNGILVDGSGGGTLILTGFANNSVHQGTAGTGVSVTNATFDSDLVSAGIQQVSGGSTLVGVSGDGVGGAGMVLTTVQGDLSFADLDIFADGGSGLRVTGTGAFTAAAGMRVMVGAGVGIIEATGGPAVEVSNATIDLQLFSLKSTNTTSTGVSLVNVSDGSTINAVFSAPSGSITTTAGATGPIFNVNGGNAAITYGGAITNNGTGRAVSIDGWSGDDIGDNLLLSGAIDENGAGILVNGNGGSHAITFSGGMDIDTTTGEGFAATSNANTGGLHITGTNTIDSTSATALRVTDTPIGSSDLTFEHVSSGNNAAAADPVNGIVLSNTGTSGGLKVTGSGASGQGGNGTGGLIQNTTSHGVSLTNTREPSFINMTIQNTGGSGINGTLVTDFTFDNGTITGSGDATQEANIAFNGSGSLTGNNANGVVTITDSVLNTAFDSGLYIESDSGTISNLTVSNNSFTSTTSDATSRGDGVKVVVKGNATTAANLTRATIANNVIANFPSGAGIQVIGGNSSTTGPGGSVGTSGSGTNVVSITGNRIAGPSSVNRMGTSAIAVSINGGNSGSRSQGNFDVSGNGTVANPLTNMDGTAIIVGHNGYATGTYTMSNNVIVANNINASPGIGGGNGIVVSSAETPDLTWTINNNTISNTDGNGILAVSRGVRGIMKVKIQNNTVAAPLTGVRPGIRVDAGNAASVDDAVCLNISGNTSGGSGGHEGIGLRKQGTNATVNDFGIHGMAATSSPGVEQYVGNGPGGQNPGTANGSFGTNGVLLLSATSGFSNCSLP